GTCSYSLKGDEACKDVCQGYEHDGLASAGQYGAHFRRQDVEREIHQVAVRNHAALGSASCSGGIHDCGYIVSVGCGATRVPCFSIWTKFSLRTEVVKTVVHDPDAPELS